MNQIELHVAGATVQSESPFSGLDVPVYREPLNKTLLEEWVRPLYFGLEKPHVAEFVKKHRSLITDELILDLLTHYDWRPRTTAAYLAAIGRRKSFTEHIGRLLLRSDVCYAGSAYCMALATFNSPEALSFLKQYLDYYLTRIDLWFDQRSAMAATAYLDGKNHTNTVSSHMPAWNEFIKNKTNWDLQESVSFFMQNMEILNALQVAEHG